MRQVYHSHPMFRGASQESTDGMRCPSQDPLHSILAPDANLSEIPLFAFENWLPQMSFKEVSYLRQLLQ